MRCARLRDDPAGFGPDYWRRGAELGWASLLVSEETRRRHHQRRALIDLTLIAHEFGQPRGARPAGAGEHRRGRARASTAERIPRCCRAWCRASRSRPGPIAERSTSSPSTGAPVGYRVRGRGGRPRWREAPRRVRRSGRPAARHGPQRFRPHPGSRARRRRRRHDRARWSSVDLTRRFSTVRFDDVRLPARRGRRRGRRCRAPGRAPAADRRRDRTTPRPSARCNRRST